MYRKIYKFLVYLFNKKLIWIDFLLYEFCIKLIFEWHEIEIIINKYFFVEKCVR